MGGPQSRMPPEGPYGGPVPPGGWTQPLGSPVETRPLASFGRRAGAWVVDALIVLLVAGAVIALLVSALIDSDAGVVAIFITSLLSFLVLTMFALVYAPLTMMRGDHNGQTLGKQLLGIRVVRTNGQPVDFATAALREAGLKVLALGVASSIVPVIPFLVDYLWPLFDDDNQAVHDIIVGTRVVEG